MGARVVQEQAREPSAATRTIHKDGLVTDGPFIESKDVIAGFFVVETADLDDGGLEDAHRREWASVLAATVRVTRDLDPAEERARSLSPCASSAACRPPASPGVRSTWCEVRRLLALLLAGYRHQPAVKADPLRRRNKSGTPPSRAGGPSASATTAPNARPPRRPPRRYPWLWNSAVPSVVNHVRICATSSVFASESSSSMRAFCGLRSAAPTTAPPLSSS